MFYINSVQKYYNGNQRQNCIIRKRYVFATFVLNVICTYCTKFIMHLKIKEMSINHGVLLAYIHFLLKRWS